MKEIIMSHKADFIALPVYLHGQQELLNMKDNDISMWRGRDAQRYSMFL